MTTIYDSGEKVKPARKARRFAEGLDTRPRPTEADRRWWAENAPSNARDYDVTPTAPDLDTRAGQAAFMDAFNGWYLPAGRMA